MKVRLPYLYLCIFLPCVSIHTELFYEDQCSRVFSYVRLFVKVFKWETSFRLYSPEYR